MCIHASYLGRLLIYSRYPIKRRITLYALRQTKVITLSNLAPSQKLTLILVCAAVVFLLAPYAGCRLGLSTNSPSPQEHEAPANARDGRDVGDETESSNGARKEPLGQIEDLLSQ